jgi:hypothetical protein
MSRQRSLILISAFCIFAFGVTSNAVFADPDTNSKLERRPEKRSLSKHDKAVKSSYRMAVCMHSKRSLNVINHLSSFDPNAQNEAELALAREIECDNLQGSNALVGQQFISTSPSVFRGMLAEAVLSSKGHLKNNAKLLEILPLAESYNRDWFALTKRATDIDAMAICASETNPNAVLQLLRTEHVSPEEKVAIDNVIGTLGPCLRQGMTLNTNRLSIRAALAEAYFHRIYTPVKNTDSNGTRPDA